MSLQDLIAGAAALSSQRVSQDQIAAMAKANGATTPEQIAFVQAIFDTESSGGNNPNAYQSRIVGNGSTISGPMQVQTKAANGKPSTFDQFAAPGKADPNNPLHTAEAGVRYALEAIKRSNGDYALAAKRYQAGLGFDGKSTLSDGNMTTDQYAQDVLRNAGKRLGVPIAAPSSLDSGISDVQRLLAEASTVAKKQAVTNGQTLDTFGMNVEGANQMLAMMAGRMQKAATAMETARAERSYAAGSSFGDRFAALLKADNAAKAESAALADFTEAAKMTETIQGLAKTQLALQASTSPQDAKLIDAQVKLLGVEQKAAAAEDRARLMADIQVQRNAIAESQIALGQQRNEITSRMLDLKAAELQAKLDGTLKTGGKPGISSVDVVAAGKVAGLSLPEGTDYRAALELLKGNPEKLTAFKSALTQSAAAAEMDAAKELPLAPTMIGAAKASVDYASTSDAAITTKTKIAALWEAQSQNPDLLFQLSGRKATSPEARQQVIVELQNNKTSAERYMAKTEEALKTALGGIATGRFGVPGAAAIANSSESPYVPQPSQTGKYLKALESHPVYGQLAKAAGPVLSNTAVKPKDLYMGLVQTQIGLTLDSTAKPVPGAPSPYTQGMDVVAGIIKEIRLAHIADSEFIRHNVPVPRATYMPSPTGTAAGLNLEDPEQLKVWSMANSSMFDNANTLRKILWKKLVE